MFFEGSEKKFEIVFKTHINLREIEQSFWEDVVKYAKATILSSIDNYELKAFLLSESSLFVSKNRIVMITCGQTTLVHSLTHILKRFPAHDIELLTFQRKNEYFSPAQATSFIDDVEVLKKYIPGRAYRFGPLDSHHNLIFLMEKEYLNDNDHTTELLMYDISTEASQFLTRTNLTDDELRNYFKINKLLKGFEIDDFVFKPYGYSLNAIKEDKYFTIHVTPQRDSSYVSFETNINLHTIGLPILETMVEVVRPYSLDLISFNANIDLKLTSDYKVNAIYKDNLPSNLDVNFIHYFRETYEVFKPVLLENGKI